MSNQRQADHIDVSDRPILRVRDLAVTFAPRTAKGAGVAAVSGVSFDLGPGEVLAIVGETGCGKSATALALMGLLPGSAKVDGVVELDGVDFLALGEQARSRVRGRRVSMIFQDPLSALNPVLTVGIQITEVLRRHMKMSRRVAVHRARQLLDDVGIPDPDRRLNEYPHQLSGGMRQRVMIAIAIACDPDVLIADEPTTALDTTIQAQILELLQELSRRKSMALILITHDLGVVAGMADRVLVMYGGLVVESAGRYELFDSPRHRYTNGLLGSLPRLESERVEELTPIPGSAFDRRDWGEGCAFAPRCTFSVEACEAPHLALLEAAPAHAVRCANPAPVLERSAL